MNERKIVVAVLLALILTAPAAAGVRRPIDRERDRHATEHEEEWERHEREHHAERDAHADEHADEWDAHDEEEVSARRAHDREHDRGRHERAGHHDDHGRRRHGERDRRWAEVVHVRPIYDRFRVVEPRQECRTETVTTRRDGARVGGTLIGATLGGAVGHGMGHDRRSRRRGTIFGAILGGVLGHEIGDRHARRHDHTRTREVERCHTVDRVTWEKRVVGYDVEYRYRGRLYHARTDDHPGDRIRVKVDVRPRGHRF